MNQEKLNALFEKAFWTLVATLIALAGWIGSSISASLKEVSASVTDLNATMKVLVKQVDSQDKILDQHETRLRDLEHKR